MEREIPADELAEAVEHLRERLDSCKRGLGGVPQGLADHAIEIVLTRLADLEKVERRAREVLAEVPICPEDHASRGTAKRILGEA